ncbi:MAG: sugar transporter [Bacteroidia bacterium]|nr:sugar transporter [Bacteroidia bacterium]
MKKIFILLSFFATFFGFSQAPSPVKWEASYLSINADEGEIIIVAKIDKGWHIYSQNIAPDAGPIPTSFNYTPGTNFELVGKTVEGNAHEVFDKAFDTKLQIFDDKAEFKQKIKLKNSKGFTTLVKLEFMTCNDMQCLPPKTIELTVNIASKK